MKRKIESVNDDIEDKGVKKVKEEEKQKITITELILEQPIAIRKGEIELIDGGKWELKNDGRTLRIYSESSRSKSNSIMTFNNNFMSISGGQTIINGVSISTGNNEIRLSNVGNKRIIIDGKDITKSIHNSKIEKENPIFKYENDYKLEINKLSCNGGMNIDLYQWFVSKDKLTIKIVGSSDIKLCDLEIKDCRIQIAGSGDVSGKETKINNLDVQISGSGDVKNLHVTESVDANVSGSGDISITANKNVQISKSGSIDIKKIDY